MSARSIPADIEIARAAALRPIQALAQEKLGLAADELILVTHVQPDGGYHYHGRADTFYDIGVGCPYYNSNKGRIEIRSGKNGALLRVTNGQATSERLG